MTVLIINTFYYPKFTGGAEISVQLLAEGLLKEGKKVFVLTTGSANRVYRVNGVVVIALKQRNIYSNYFGTTKPQLLKMVWHFIDSANIFYHFKISSLLKKIKPDLVHTNNIQGFSPFIWHTIKIHKINLVHTTRDYYLLCHKCNLYNNNKDCESLCLPCKVTHNIKKRFTAYPDRFVGISNYILQKHKQYLQISGQNKVIYNAVSLQEKPASSQVGANITFGYIGRIVKDKGVEYLADELSKLSPELKLSFKIVFAGDGDTDFINRLKRQASIMNF